VAYTLSVIRRTHSYTLSVIRLRHCQWIGTPNFSEYVQCTCAHYIRRGTTVHMHNNCTLRPFCKKVLVSYITVLCVLFYEICFSYFHVYICTDEHCCLRTKPTSPQLMTCRFTNSSQMASGRLAHVLLTNNTAVSNWHLSLRPYYIYQRVHCLSLRYCPIIVVIRETRKGWPLLTIETEANGDLLKYKWRLSFLGWFARLVVPVWEIFFLPWLLW